MTKASVTRREDKTCVRGRDLEQGRKRDRHNWLRKEEGEIVGGRKTKKARRELIRYRYMEVDRYMG